MRLSAIAGSAGGSPNQVPERASRSRQERESLRTTWARAAIQRQTSADPEQLLLTRPRRGGSRGVGAAWSTHREHRRALATRSLVADTEGADGPTLGLLRRATATRPERS